ncbi:regulatory protein, luxR family [Salinihabitans flavidus]|uniref:Regulatory protein, luxR family n=1 Tax=Salinihabitans flavidus TaxID=569882 RepID=A0A1H8TLI6_9RHOB|nr:helix-turn-helix transcriptional regulator [Salinihabitans flavidus]SEO91691.1 regulatory protein, luxR family [Salinihabitans flavidus]
MEDKTAPPDSDAILVSLDDCLARLGDDGWAEAFVTLALQTGAAQVMIFSYTADSAACLLSRNFRAKALGARLGEEYLRGWFREDPLFGLMLSMPPGTLQRIESQRIAAQMSEAYRTRFYDQPGLQGKTAILATGTKLRLAVNLYWQRSDSPGTQRFLETIMGRLALLHFEARPEQNYPAPLAVLSNRERAVCLGILSGKKAEAIAADLGVAVTSVVTYRTRAYQKLGISSRGSLFTVCGK